MLVSPETFEALVQFSDWLREQSFEEIMLDHSDELVARFLDEIRDE